MLRKPKKRHYFAFFLSLLLFLEPKGLFYTTAVQADSDTAYTGYEKMVDTAFQPGYLSRNFDIPSPGEKRAIESVRSATITLIQSAYPVWIKKIAGSAPTTEIDRREIFEILEQTPIRVCKVKCECGNGQNGCVVGKPLSNSFGALFTFESCALTPKGCPRDTERAKGLEYRLFKYFSQNLTQIAFWKFKGFPLFVPNQQKKDLNEAVNLIQEARGQMTRLRNACPRAFPEWGQALLEKELNLTPQNEYVEKCGQKIISALLNADKIQKCREIIDPEKYKKLFKEGLFKIGVKFEKCNAICALMTCGQDANTDARLIRFGERRWIGILGSNSCEGQYPTQAEPFLNDAIQWISNAGESERKGCVRALYQGPILNKEKLEGVKDQGPQVDLIPENQ